MVIRLLESARDDLREGWRFYEMNAAGLGDYFLDPLQSDIQALPSFAGIHERVAGYHRMLAKRFPFAIYHLLDAENINVYAILDCRRS